MAYLSDQIDQTKGVKVYISDGSGNQITSLTNTQYAEDAAHTSGDTGTMALAVRNDSGAVLAGTSGDYIPLTTDPVGALRVNGGGATVAINGSFTRPSDTTAYAAGDAATDSTSAPTVITFTNCASANAGTGTIIGATLIDSANQSTKGIFELWLFDTTFTPDNDNAVFTPTDAELATLVGVVPFDVSYVGDATSGAGGNAIYMSGLLNLPFVAGASSRNLFGALVVRNAYTPVSAEVFTIRLNIAQN